MIFNVVSGVGKFATINVTAPAGTTVTCVQSPYSFSKSTGSGTSVSFVVPKSGNWTVTATVNSASKSETVNAASYGGSYSVSFVFESWLFKEGTGGIVAWDRSVSKYESAAGWGAHASGTASITTSKMTVEGDNWAVSESESGTCYGQVYTKNAVNVSAYTKLVVECSAEMYGLLVSVGSKSFKVNSSGRHTETLDISSVTGNVTITFRGNQYNQGGTVYNAYLQA